MNVRAIISGIAGSIVKIELRAYLKFGSLWTDTRLEEKKQTREEAKKLIEVAGRPFRNAEDNLDNLWEHVTGALAEDFVSELDLDQQASLSNIEIRRRRRNDGRKPGKKRRKPSVRLSQAMKDLIGLVGEIHAYRALQKSYGAEVVGPINWKSEMSLHKFPENVVDDSLGCDFVIQNEGKTIFIEVKATKGSDEIFELGSSETRLAVETANKRKKLFKIIHVLDALSNNPQIRLLPNPYDRRHKDKYVFEEAGLRVRYEMT